MSKAIEYYVTDAALLPLLRAVNLDRKRYLSDTEKFLQGWDGGEFDENVGITTLIDSPKPKRLLSGLPKGTVKVNAASMLPALRGTAMHEMLERATNDMGGAAEVRLGRVYTSPTSRTQWLVHHAFDCLHGDVYIDWKGTTSGSLAFDKPHWEFEINYAVSLIEEQLGKPVERMCVGALVDDWRPHKLRERNMPQEAAVVIEIPRWSTEKLDDHIAARIVEHEKIEVPPCTDEERWQRSKGYKVYGYKKDGSPSTKAMTAEIFDSREKAVDAAGDKPIHKIDEIKSGPMRCIHYCDASDFCDQHKNWIASTLNKG